MGNYVRERKKFNGLCVAKFILPHCITQFIIGVRGNNLFILFFFFFGGGGGGHSLFIHSFYSSTRRKERVKRAVLLCALDFFIPNAPLHDNSSLHPPQQKILCMKICQDFILV